MMSEAKKFSGRGLAVVHEPLPEAVSVLMRKSAFDPPSKGTIRGEDGKIAKAKPVVVIPK